MSQLRRCCGTETYLMCAALGTISSNVPSLRMFRKRFQKTPVASIASWVQLGATSPAMPEGGVEVSKVRHSRLIFLPT